MLLTSILMKEKIKSLDKYYTCVLLRIVWDWSGWETKLVLPKNWHSTSSNINRTGI